MDGAKDVKWVDSLGVGKHATHMHTYVHNMTISVGYSLAQVRLPV